MARPGITVIKTLFALSGNSCYLDGCEERLTDPSWQSVFGEIAHIRGKKKNAPRYDPRQSEKERNDFPNLMLLCPKCHTRIDRTEPDRFPVETLEEIKARHEARSQDKMSWAPDEVLNTYATQLIISIGLEETNSQGDDEALIELNSVPPDPWDGVEHVNDWDYDDNVKLWVVVTNRGLTGRFQAQVSNTEGFPSGWGDYTRPIAWEETSEATLEIAPNTKSRLFLGNVSRNPPCFWFYGPRDEMYTKNVHTIWQQNREFNGRISFDLQVVNLATGTLAIKRGTVVQGDPEELPEFSLE